MGSPGIKGYILGQKEGEKKVARKLKKTIDNIQCRWYTIDVKRKENPHREQVRNSADENPMVFYQTLSPLWLTDKAETTGWVQRCSQKVEKST